MTKAIKTKDSIVDRALDLLLQRGLNGFSYRDISKYLNIKNAAIHYYFPTKMDLIKAIIEENYRIFKKGTAEFMAYGGQARAQLEGLFMYTAEEYERGCPICLIGSLAVDYDDLSEEVQQANERFIKNSLKWFTRVLEVGKEQGEFEFQGDPKDKAVSILATIQGARQMARAHGLELLDRIFRQIRTDLGIVD